MPDSPLDYQTHSPKGVPPVSRGHRLIEIAVILGIIVLLVSIIVSTRRRWEETRSVIPSAEHLRQIGQSIMLYAYANSGQYPPDFTTLAKTQPISLDSFTHPGATDTPPASPAELSQPGHCSFIYVGSGLKTTSDPESIVAFGDPADFAVEGAQVLYGDGHVDWQDIAGLISIWNDLTVGRNPPTSKSSSTHVAAQQDYRRNWQWRMPALKQSGWRIPATQPAR